MTTIAFQLGQLTPLEARALSAMLTVMAGQPTVTQTIPVTVATPLSTDFKVEPIPGTSDFNVLPVGEPAADAQNGIQEALTEALATLTPSEPEPAPQPTRRRRTKAEMEAARAAEATKPEAPAATGPVNPPPATEPATEPATTTADPKAPTLDKLRAALQSYVARHDMTAALALLGEFGPDEKPFTRVSELQALPVVDQLEFVRLATHA